MEFIGYIFIIISALVLIGMTIELPKIKEDR
jgi:hypothetical protein